MCSNNCHLCSEYMMSAADLALDELEIEYYRKIGTLYKAIWRCNKSNKYVDKVVELNKYLDDLRQCKDVYEVKEYFDTVIYKQ